MPNYATNRVDPKAPDDEIIYDFKFGNQLSPGATISSATWSAPGLTVGTITNTATETAAFLSGGNDGEDYAVEATIVASNGERKTMGGMLKVRKATTPRIG